MSDVSALLLTANFTASIADSLSVSLNPSLSCTKAYIAGAPRDERSTCIIRSQLYNRPITNHLNSRDLGAQPVMFPGHVHHCSVTRTNDSNNVMVVVPFC